MADPTPIPVQRVDPAVVALVEQQMRITAEARAELLEAVLRMQHPELWPEGVSLERMSAEVVNKAVRWSLEVGEAVAVEDDLRRAVRIQAAIDDLIRRRGDVA